jgi:hypothetical protein
MTTKASTASKWVMAREAVVVIVGARAPTYRTVYVRNRHTGMVEEVPLAPIEAPPIDEGDPGQTFVFKKHERVEADHPAVRESPGSFIPYEKLED